MPWKPGGGASPTPPAPQPTDQPESASLLDRIVGTITPREGEGIVSLNPAKTALNFLGTPASIITSTIKEGTDLLGGQAAAGGRAPVNEASFGDWWRQISQPHQRLGAGDLLSSRETMFGFSNPFTPEKINQSVPLRVGSILLGFTGDVLTDPLSFVGAPGAHALKAGGRRLLAQSAAANRTSYGLRLGVRRRDETAARLSNELQEVTKKYDDAARKFAMADDPAEKVDLLVARQDAEQAVNEVGRAADAHLEASGLGAELDKGIWSLARPGGGAAEITDDTMLELLTGGQNTSGLRLRPFWRTEGGAQLVSPERWARWTAPVRENRGRVGQTRGGRKVRGWFGSEGNTIIMQAANDFAREGAGNPGAFSKHLALLDHKTEIDRRAFTWQSRQMNRVSQLREGNAPSSAQAEALLAAIETPPTQWSTAGVEARLRAAGMRTETVVGLKNLRDSIELDARAADIEFGDLGDTYMPVRLKREVDAGADINMAGPAAFERSRGAGTTFLDEPVVSIQNAVDKGLAHVDEATGKVIFDHPDEMNWATWRDELEEIAQRKLGDDYRPDLWEKDPFRLMQAYIGQVTRRLQGKGYQAAAKNVGLGMWAEDLDGIGQMAKLRPKHAQMEADFVEAEAAYASASESLANEGDTIRAGPLFGAEQEALATQKKVLQGIRALTYGVRTRPGSKEREAMGALREFAKSLEAKKGGVALFERQRDAAEQVMSLLGDAETAEVLRGVGADQRAKYLAEAMDFAGESMGGDVGRVVLPATEALGRFAQRMLDTTDDISDDLAAALDGDDVALALDALTAEAMRWQGHVREFETLREVLPDQIATDWASELGSIEQMMLARAEQVETLARETRTAMTGRNLQVAPQAAVADAASRFRSARERLREVSRQLGRLPKERAQTEIGNDIGLRSWQHRLLRPDEIEVHPEHMQVRRNVTAEGVTERLESPTWSPLAAGSLVVWQRNNGALWVVDGHHRTELAKRLAGEGATDQFGDPIMLPAKIFRESDGNDLERMYLYGALVNLGEGRLDEVTLARAMRGTSSEFTGLLDSIIPKNRAGGIVGTATALSRLSDEAWQKAVQMWDEGPRWHTPTGERVGREAVEAMSQAERSRLRMFDPEKNMNQLRGIADVTDDPRMQAALVDAVASQGFRGETEARLFLRRAAQSGAVTETQTMFGSEVGLSGLREQARLTAAVGRAIDNAKGAMLAGLRGADVLETVEGTRVARGGTAAETDMLRVVRQAFEADAERDPATLEMLARAVQRVSDGELSMTAAAGEVAQEYVGRLRNEISAGGGIEQISQPGMGTYWRSPGVAARQAEQAGTGAPAPTTAAPELEVDMFGAPVEPPPVATATPDEPTRLADDGQPMMQVEGETSMFGAPEPAAPAPRTGQQMAREMLDADQPGQRAIQREAAELGVNPEFAAAMHDIRRVQAVFPTPAKFAQWFHSTPDDAASAALRDLPEGFAVDVAAEDWDTLAANWWPAKARQRAPMPTESQIAEMNRPKLIADLKAARAAEDSAAADLAAAAAQPAALAPTTALLSDRELSTRVRQAVAMNSPERAAWNRIMRDNPAAGLLHTDETAKARFWLGENGEGISGRLAEAEADYAANPTPAGDVEVTLLREAMSRVEQAGRIKDALPLMDQPRAAELLNIVANADMAAANAARLGQLKTGADAAYAAKDDLGQGLANIAATMEQWAANEVAVRNFADEFGERIVQWEGMHTSEDVARAFDAALELQRPGPLLKKVNEVASWWRGNALLSPGYHVRNIYSALINNMLHGVTPRVQKRAIAEYTRWARGQTIGDREMRDFIEEAMAFGTIGQGHYATDIREVGRADTTWNPLAGLPGTDTERQWRPVHANRAAGNHIENAVRLGAAFTAAKRAPAAGGAQARQSAARALVHRIHFDYTDLSNLERNYIRNVSMFWTWMSRNMMLQADMITTRPQVILTAERLYRNIGAGAPVNPYTPEYYDENEYRQISQRWYSTAEIPMFSAVRDINKLSNVTQGNAPVVRAMSEYSPWMREGLEMLTGRDALRGYELRGSEKAKRAAGAIFPLYARARRLAPQILGGSEGERERQLSSFFGWVGIPVREVSNTEMRYQRRLREDMIRGWQARDAREAEARELLRAHRAKGEDAVVERELAQLAG